MTSPLAQCRHTMSRHRGIRALWLLTILGLLIASVPRWEMHQHALVDHDNAHTGLARDHHHDVTDYTDTDDGIAVTHFHSVPSFSIALTEVGIPSLERVASRDDAFASPDSNPVASCWPPPHRPPIV